MSLTYLSLDILETSNALFEDKVLGYVEHNDTEVLVKTKR